MTPKCRAFMIKKHIKMRNDGTSSRRGKRESREKSERVRVKEQKEVE